MRLLCKKPISLIAIAFAGTFLFSSCQKEEWAPLEEVLNSSEERGNNASTSNGSAAVLLVIDEESIDNGNQPNNFSERDVNDQIATVGQRSTLRYFQSNVGKSINLYTGEVGDEGWHALKTIPNSWKTAGPTSNGSQNFLKAGPGLGGGNDDREVLLDKIPNLTPLRATGLKMLIGQTVLAVVYDSDISINYGPLNGNLQGANLGMVALKVEQVTKRTDGSSGSLPVVKVKILSVESVKALPLKLFSNAPVPRSSSEPYDINPPATAAAVQLTTAP
ncbi:MAG: hypothetical protein JNK20_02050 [Flavipsychrobacter sp.]|nr:hypothetical protein [Flavipsychrobacter sp.]